MKIFIIIFPCVFLNLAVFAQLNKISKTRIVAGLSATELLHGGITYRIANVSQVGFNAGVGPAMGGLWTAVSLEHRLYFGKNTETTNQKTWFFRQGSTFFPSAESPRQFTLNLSIGKDLFSRSKKNGLTIDAGVFYLPESEESSVILVKSLNLWPAIRFEFYFSL